LQEEIVPSPLRFGILGPLLIERSGVPLHLTAGKLRIFLATLLLKANEWVSVEELADRLWDGGGTDIARRTIHVYALRLRKALGDDARASSLILTRNNGYVLRIDPENVDLLRFRQRCAEARHAADAGERKAEATRLREAIALWRGSPLPDVGSDSMQRDVVPQLQEELLHAREHLADVELALGRHREIVGELMQLTRTHPWHERFWIQLVRALQQSDRTADALAACHRVERLFHTDLGIDPGEELRTLHREILLASTTDTPGEPPGSRTAGTTAGTVGRSVHQLPPAVHNFVGRHALAAECAQLLVPGPRARTDGRSRPAQVALSGLPGVGKTALAVEVAHRLRRHFPDGQLFVDLQGYSAAPPASPRAVLQRFLRALGVPQEQVPGSTQDCSAFYRSLVADRRFLVVLDNAVDAAQVRPLLPGGPGCAVFVTSRNDLRGLVATHGLHRRQVPVLDPPAARALLATMIGPRRAATDPDAMRQITERCACLPLALRIAGTNLAADRYLDLRAYAKSLHLGDGLSEFVVKGDESISARTAIDFSRRWLSPEDERLFRMLDRAPLDEFTVRSMTELAGPGVDVERSLHRLVAMSLVQQRGRGRYQIHGLIRCYVRAMPVPTVHPGGVLSDVDCAKPVAPAVNPSWFGRWSTHGRHRDSVPAGLFSCGTASSS
jgi:DNA-binding SARP family transcriptional activator